jgi:hypothetical protein
MLLVFRGNVKTIGKVSQGLLSVRASVEMEGKSLSGYIGQAFYLLFMSFGSWCRRGNGRYKPKSGRQFNQPA